MGTPRRRCSRFAPTGSLFAVRHGQRADHADEHWHETASRPHDPPLTALGLKQAEATGRALSNERVDAVYSSPFMRCMQTAAAIAEPHGLSVRVEPGIGEMLASCEEHGWGFDTDPYDAAFSARRLAAEHDFAVDQSYEPLWDSAGRGVPPALWPEGRAVITFPESWDTARARYQATLRSVQTASPFAVLVTHGAGVMSIAETVVPSDDVDDCGYCCITNLHQAGGGRWQCTQRGTAHHDAIDDDGAKA